MGLCLWTQSKQKSRHDIDFETHRQMENTYTSGRPTTWSIHHHHHKSASRRSEKLLEITGRQRRTKQVSRQRLLTTSDEPHDTFASLELCDILPQNEVWTLDQNQTIRTNYS